MTDKGYQNIMALVNAMQQRGYKLKKTKAYGDAKRGLLRVQDDGTITATDAKAYELTLSLGRDLKTSVEVLEAVETKTELEAEKIRLQNEKLRWEMERDQGKWVLRESFEMELATRAAYLEMGIRNFFETKAASWIGLVGGKVNKAHLMINEFEREFDALINSYYDMRRFNVNFVIGDLSAED
jgi:hypothetical protein